LSTGATASDAACDDAHRIELAVYVWRANWESGRLRAGLDNPRRLAMVEYAQQVWGADTRSFGQNHDASPSPEIFWVGLHGPR
jgi:hypothetical protein